MPGRARLYEHEPRQKAVQDLRSTTLGRRENDIQRRDDEVAEAIDLFSNWEMTTCPVKPWGGD